ncbi:protein mono-ADP-ribosyltransferase PARP3 isoform X2 [Hemicordylus capensis]|uniref:protein mono-ADP-ribosyltransferase PARP3 isoform X2 n=1 Tax=Hemicordylus capensis TaxID=884348 RepID=UPI0023049E5D|nr:protein mono-ADP-ribosyltransferase PARP3 isoform X2 [Hemicordylus capensis]
MQTMAPKRKAAAQAAIKGKKVKEEPQSKPEPEEDSFRSTMESLKAAPKEKLKAKIDSACQLSNIDGAKIHEDYDCMLNQTNIGYNNNKFYIIQLIEQNGSYSCWNRWGRVVDTVDGVKLSKQRVRPCTLNKATQDLVSLIFSNDMFKEAMQTMNIDVKKMPLGKLSKQQIAKGFEALEAIEAALQKPRPSQKQLQELSSRFYTIIPHNFGRTRPPSIDTQEVVQAKKDMLLVLADIELAQSLQAQKKKEEEEEEEMEVEEVPHPLDKDYGLLKCELTLVDPSSEDYKLIVTYVKKTGGTYRELQVLNVWKVNRESEGSRFKIHDHLENRRLLWHGTNVAVIAAILKSGLRIMPHSGGRVGKGLYFASENSKSAGYVGTTSTRVGIMFLNEVALGKEYRITRDDPSLRKPPDGYDSVVACGVTEPDPAYDKELILEGKTVLVSQGKPISMTKYRDSSFSQSEYLIYQESQCRIRYLVELHF